MHMNAKVRQSNFELLRIFCMLGVVTNHVLQNCYLKLHSADFGWANDMRILLMCMSITAVNCFVMISGYFRIKQSWRGFFNLYTQCAFWMLVLTVLAFVFLDGPVMDIPLKTVFALSGSGYWFMVAYFALYLFAPLLNTAFENQNQRQRVLSLAALIVMDVYVGYMHQTTEVSINGYSAIHFFVIYYLGMFISSVKETKLGGGTWFAFSVLMLVMHTIKTVFPPFAIIFSLRYNSPSVMVASVLFFCWARKWTLQSKVVNWISSSVLAVYLIHSGPFGSHVFFAPLKWMAHTLSPFLSCVSMVAFTLGFYLVCILLDKIRIFVCNPLNRWMAEKAANVMSRVEGKLFP